MPRNFKNKKNADQNLALIAVVLGSTSFFLSIFTGIPAVIVGIIALRRKAGDQLQAKLAILFAVLSTIMWALAIWFIGIHFFKAPLSQQYSVSREDYKRMTATINSLKRYKHDHGNFPACQDTDTSESCSDWQRFMSEDPNLIKNQILFLSDATSVPSQPEGTIVYVTKAACFFNTPTLPSYLRDKNDYNSGPSDDTVALVYFHAKGRACYSTDQEFSD